LSKKIENWLPTSSQLKLTQKMCVEKEKHRQSDHHYMTSLGHQLNLHCPNDVTTSGVQSVCEEKESKNGLKSVSKKEKSQKNCSKKCVEKK